jgi:uncharacterized protein (TIGR02266 family)
MHEERRSFDRVPVETEVSLGSESQFFAGLSGDVSTGGIFVATYRVLPIGAHVTVEFALGDRTISAKGTVRWIREARGDTEPGIGIAFDDLTAETRADIVAFCAHRAPLYHDDAL